MQKYNIVWAIVDSVRKYHSADDRSRLNFMDEFAKESIEFKNVVTSAPSTVMSISAMMTSLPSYYLGRNYSDFRFDNNYFTTLSKILNSNDYETRALIMHKEIREKLRVFDLISKRYWPKNYSHSQWWNNEKIFQLLKNSLEIDNKKYPKPLFWFLDFNCRNDSETSNIVKKSFKLLSENGFNDDNTIFILCSDHGYPDPRRGITPDELKRKGLTHDIFMTDDNITIPLFIKYPGCKKNTIFNNTISTLDLMPTILDILNIDIDKKIKDKWEGVSLKSFIETNKKYPDRIIRTDARFLGQSGRVSALRNDKYKYVYYHDSKIDEFYDVSRLRLNEKKIPYGENKLTDNLYKKFKNEFRISEQRAINFQVTYSIYKITNQINNIHFDANTSVAVVAKNSPNFKKNIFKALIKSITYKKIDLILVDNLSNKSYKFNDENIYKKTKLKSCLKNKNKNKNYQLLIVIDDVETKQIRSEISELENLIKYDKKIVMDINMNISLRKGEILRYIKTLKANKDFYFQEPTLFIYEILRIFKIIKTRYLR